jgi:hypothetical protein
VVGLSACLIAQPKDASADIRYIQTSFITEIIKVDEFTTRIKTESGSTYEITEIEDTIL